MNFNQKLLYLIDDLIFDFFFFCRLEHISNKSDKNEKELLKSILEAHRAFELNELDGLTFIDPKERYFKSRSNEPVLILFFFFFFLTLYLFFWKITRAEWRRHMN